MLTKRAAATRPPMAARDRGRAATGCPSRSAAAFSLATCARSLPCASWTRTLFATTPRRPRRRPPEWTRRRSALRRQPRRRPRRHDPLLSRFSRVTWLLEGRGRGRRCTGALLFCTCATCLRGCVRVRGIRGPVCTSWLGACVQSASARATPGALLLAGSARRGAHGAGRADRNGDRCGRCKRGRSRARTCVGALAFGLDRQRVRTPCTLAAVHNRRRGSGVGPVGIRRSFGGGGELGLRGQ